MTKTVFYGIMIQYQRWCSLLGGIGLRAGNAKRKTGLTAPPLNPVLVYLRVSNNISINKTINSVVVISITTFHWITHSNAIKNRYLVNPLRIVQGTYFLLLFLPYKRWWWKWRNTYARKRKQRIILLWYSPVLCFALGASTERNILPYNNVATWRGLCYPFSI